MMRDYEPKRSEVNDKANELLETWLYEDGCSGLIDAVAMNIELVKALLEAPLDDLADARTNLLMAIEKYAYSCRDFHSEAEDALIAQVGYYKQTDVDDFKFVAHSKD